MRHSILLGARNLTSEEHLYQENTCVPPPSGATDVINWLWLFTIVSNESFIGIYAGLLLLTLFISNNNHQNPTIDINWLWLFTIVSNESFIGIYAGLLLLTLFISNNNHQNPTIDTDMASQDILLHLISCHTIIYSFFSKYLKSLFTKLHTLKRDAEFKQIILVALRFKIMFSHHLKEGLYTTFVDQADYLPSYPLNQTMTYLLG